MTFKYPTSGVHSTAAYVPSGYPWVTGSVLIDPDATQKHQFDHVTKFFIVSNVGPGPLRLGFTLNGISGSYHYTIAAGEERQMDLRIRDLYMKNTGSLSGTYDLVAGITGIRRRDFLNLTGSANEMSGSVINLNIG